jgi:hypothetical protein
MTPDLTAMLLVATCPRAACRDGLEPSPVETSA